MKIYLNRLDDRVFLTLDSGTKKEASALHELFHNGVKIESFGGTGDIWRLQLTTVHKPDEDYLKRVRYLFDSEFREKGIRK